jgi:xanthine dehydrogenase accessory factor
MLKAIIRGGGDLASGIAVRLHRCGINVIISELEKPLTVRRYVSYAEAVYTKSIIIEEIQADLVQNISEAKNCFEKNVIPVIVDENLTLCRSLSPDILIDARMLKKKVRNERLSIPQVIGIGPGFFPGDNCDCVIETKRGPFLGRVYWHEPVESDTGIPENVNGYESERVLRAPEAGIFKAKSRIGDIVNENEEIACVNGVDILAPFHGVIRGLLHDGVSVHPGMKVGDLDPRCDPLLCSLVSDKALAVGGGVLEAILSIPENRQKLGTDDL